MPKLSPQAQEVVLRRIRDIPSLPEVVNRIVSRLNNPNTPASEIARLISYDPGLTSKVLRMVNSAAYGFQRQISSIQHGIMILGFNNIRGLVLSAGIFKLFEGKAGAGHGPDHRHFWEHSLATAVASRCLVRQLGMQDEDDVFSAAMLHDVGKIILDVYFRENYYEVLMEASRQGLEPHGEAFFQLEDMMLGITHTGIGEYMATKWKLPLTITEVIRFHHRPEEAEGAPAIVHLVALANELAVMRSLGGGFFFEEITPSLVDYFSLGVEDLADVFAIFEEEMASAWDLLEFIASQPASSPRKAVGER